MLDTQSVVKELIKAGFDEPKAEAIVQAQLKLGPLFFNPKASPLSWTVCSALGSDHALHGRLYS
jgi:hypothetical protein